MRKNCTNMQLITRKYFRVRDLAPVEINGGWCYVWAWVAKMYFPQAVLCVDSEEDHAWVVLGGRHFDSESPKGVRGWKNLKLFKTYRQEELRGLTLKRMSKPVFKDCWPEFLTTSGRWDVVEEAEYALKGR